MQKKIYFLTCRKHPGLSSLHLLPRAGLYCQWCEHSVPAPAEDVSLEGYVAQKHGLFSTTIEYMDPSKDGWKGHDTSIANAVAVHGAFREIRRLLHSEM